MIWNIVLLFLVFGAAKKKFSPYASAAVLGLVKGVLYYLGSQSLLAALIGFLIFGGLATAMVYLFSLLDRKDLNEEPYPQYGTRRKSAFKWEYVPLSTIVFLLIFGELIATMTWA